MANLRLSKIERNLVNRISESWNRAKDSAQPRGLEFEIQFQLECAWGKALTLANEVRNTWPIAERA